MKITISYYGWSGLSINTDAGNLFFDPFFRKYCGAKWFEKNDFASAKYICVTHGHEEHFLDVPEIAKAFGSVVIGPKSITKFLQSRNKLPATPACTPTTGNLQRIMFDIDMFIPLNHETTFQGTTDPMDIPSINAGALYLIARAQLSDPLVSNWGLTAWTRLRYTDK